MTVFLDFETRSEADLRKVGAWAYSQHPSTEIICACWSVDEGPVQEWTNGALGMAKLGIEPEPPLDLLDLAYDPGEFEAHNVAFEYSIWRNVCVERYGWPMIDLERWRDTMAVCAYYALPRALDNACRALGLPGKDPEGARLITKYCKLHLKTAKREIPEEDLRKFVAYCRQDVGIERCLAYTLGDLPDAELEVFLNDFAVAERGIALDEQGIATARLVVEERAAELEEEFAAMTGSLGPGQVAKIREMLAEIPFYLELPNLQVGTIDELLDEGRVGDEPVLFIHPDARRILEVRRAHAHASTKKLDAMLRQRGSDGRARFQTIYHGAGTGRNTGTGFQPLNLKRGYDEDDVTPEQLVRDVMVGDPRWLDALYGDATKAVAKASRHWIVAPEGSRIIAGDFSSIEAIISAVQAGEQWKIDAFRDPKFPLYERTADRIWRLPEGTVTKKTHPEERQDGKKCELAFGYQGALGAWRKFDRSLRHDDAAVLGFVREWRQMNPMIVEAWGKTEDAMVEAVAYPGRVTGWGEHEMFERVDGWLTMILPDGKRIWYWAPELRMAWPQWHQPSERDDCGTGDCDCQQRLQVTYMAQKEGRWRRTYTYGGKAWENRTQSIARQILKPAELRIRDAGYRQVLGVYDEAVCEVLNGWGSVKELEELMNEPAGDWCADWPIRAKGWEGLRYRK